MKRLILLIGLVFMSNCTSINTLSKIDSFNDIRMIDFTEYSKKGFLITTEAYNGKYESIGIINCGARAAAKKHTEETTLQRGGRTVRNYEWKIEKIYIDSVLSLAYEQASKMGGDCIMNFRLTASDKTYEDGFQMVTVPGVEINGFVIKRVE